MRKINKITWSRSRTKDIKCEFDENGCWICTSHKPTSYGYIRVNRYGKLFALHRVSYEVFNGHIPEGFLIRHTCDNPRCIHPDHLILGTNADNVRDRDSRNRTALGEDHGKSKLKETDVRNIRKLAHLSSRELGRKYAVSHKAILSIRSGETWSWLK